ncbi:MAG: rhamnogalacturonan lyase [Bacteroidales bacterium]|nr:rhamnogalacturonan lyase [Bacteroidales bacterium]
MINKVISKVSIFFILTFILLCTGTYGYSQRQMENLNRGLIAVRTTGDSVYIGWRMLGTESDGVAYNLYRQGGNGKPVKLNKKPLSESTNYVDATVNLLTDNSWYVRAILNGKEQEKSESYTLKANSPVQQYLNIPLRTPSGYTPNDVSAGDLDGDGEYELVLHQTGRSIDTPSTGISGIPIFQAYEPDGTFLWEISLGRNIREGAHYTQFMVFDLDSDGIAEFACKTADGTIDGNGKVIGDSTKDWRNLNKDSGPFYGKVLDGPEYFTIFSGKTGEALVTTDYIPNRYPLNGWNGHGGNGGGDSTGNRVDRMLACVAYLDGVHPSVVMCRGYYGRSVLTAWDWRDGKLSSRWVFDSKDGENPYSGQGNHNLSVADVDGDGRDEIIYGSMVVDDNGQGLFSTGFRHGDAIHVGEFIPGRRGLQVFGIHEIEENTTGPGVAVFDARTGEVLYKGSMNKDVGRGVAGDIDPSNPGAEMWWAGSGGLFSMTGERIGEMPASTNFLIWWDADLTRELLDGNHIDKYKTGRIFTAEGCSSNNGSKSTPALSADLFGDWREEVIFRTADNKNLRIYTTVIPSKYRFRTLMHNPQYRLAIATQNVAYNQPPNTSFFIGEGMKKFSGPEISVVPTRIVKSGK